MKTSIKSPLAALAALITAGIFIIVIAGCGGDDSSSSKSVPGNAPDAAFVNDMIPHHRGAIEMAQVAQTKAQHPQIKALAAGIIGAQKSEIAVMQAVKNDLRHMGVSNGHMNMSQSEMGMDADMSILESADPFDKAFIDMMIPHHQGAIRMARRQLADGKLPALQTMAQNIIKAQTAEIEQMRTWRKQWYGAGSSNGATGSMEHGTSIDGG